MKKLFLFLICLALLHCQSTKKLSTYNDGYYFVEKFKDNKIISDSILIMVKINDNKKNNYFSSRIKYQCKEYNIKERVLTFKISNKSNKIESIELSSLGYKTIKTKPIAFLKTNSILFDFYLQEDDTPLIDCE